jgi:hypothetical protein
MSILKHLEKPRNKTILKPYFAVPQNLLWRVGEKHEPAQFQFAELVTRVFL